MLLYHQIYFSHVQFCPILQFCNAVSRTNIWESWTHAGSAGINSNMISIRVWIMHFSYIGLSHILSPYRSHSILFQSLLCKGFFWMPIHVFEKFLKTMFFLILFNVNLYNRTSNWNLVRGDAIAWWSDERVDYNRIKYATCCDSCWS